MRKLPMVTLALATMLILVGAGARAQVLDEITVTAQKREQSVQDLPMSITAMSGDTIEKLGINNSQELVQHTINLTNRAALGEGARPAYFMRGVGLSDFNTNNSGPVGVYLDEINLSSIAMQMVPVFDLDRVEILRGPQGTIFGRNTSAGAISFHSRRPTDETEGYVKAQAGNFGTTRFEGAVGGSLGETVNARFSAVKIDSDGYMNNTVSNVQEGGRDILAWRGQLAWEAGDNVDVLLIAHGGDDNSAPVGYGHLGTVDPTTFAPCASGAIAAGQCVDFFGYSDTNTDFYTGDWDFGPDNDTNTVGGALRVDWNIGDLTFTSLTGFDDIDQVMFEDADASPFAQVHTTYGVEAQTFSQEFRLVGSTEKTNWIAGVYFLTEELKQDQTADLYRDLRPLTGFDPDSFVLFSRHTSEQNTDSIAAFGQVEYRLSDRLAATVGLRWTQEDRDFVYTTVLEEPDFTIPLFTQSDSFKDDDVSGRLALDYQASDDVKLYASISKGFKAGGFNGGFAFEPTPALSYDSETLLAYELGMKGDFLDNSLRLNLSTFYYDYSDMQVFTFINAGGLPTQVLTNASDATIVGLEAEFDWQATDRLSFFLGLGLLDTEFKDFQSFIGEDLSGNTLPLAPELNMVGMALYELPLKSGASLNLQLDGSYDDDIFFTPENSFVLEQEAYGLLNARAGYVSADGNWEFSVFGKNLNGEEYFVAIFDLSDFGLLELMPGPDTTYGAELTYRF